MSEDRLRHYVAASEAFLATRKGLRVYRDAYKLYGDHFKARVVIAMHATRIVTWERLAQIADAMVTGIIIEEAV